MKLDVSALRVVSQAVAKVMAGRSVDRVDEGILKSLGRLQAAGASVGRAHATKRTIDVMLRSFHSQFPQVNAL